MFRAWLWAVAGVMLLSLGWAQPANARKTYHDVFVETYPNLAAQAREAKCDVCHIGKGAMKRNRNNYGRAMAEALQGQKNLKAGAQLTEVLKSLEGEKSNNPAKTFGDLIKANTLPAN